MFLWNREDRVAIGDIVVYNAPQRDIPIVHRVVREHVVVDEKKNTEDQFLLTKGDNNERDDLPLYGYGKTYLNRKTDIVGNVKGYIPKIGYVTILITENVYFKYAMFGFLAISALFSQD